jgi:uncharacterized membrane protein YkvA (DUF1232 family)
MARERDESKKKRTSRRRSALSIGRIASLLAFLPVASRAPIYAQLIVALIADSRTPASRKVILAGALGYLLVGRDLIPDQVPVLGGLDDLVVVVLAVDLFLDGVPADLLEEKLFDLGIERAAFDNDIAQIRRLTPGPVRRVIRRLPGMVAAAGDAIHQTGLGPRVRGWISREESIA